ncbi:MAG TPA: ATP-dependent RecD-like DNA helicase [Polyangiaceae bacterium]|nr:ATP-dependent RecD-like DNA helicase [Polyangiaceae bacterium]
MPVTLSGEVERVTFENETTSFRVLRVGSLEGDAGRRGSVVVVGTFQAVGPGTRVRITGEFVQDARHGEQLRADVLVPLEPNTLVGLERYLGSGLIPGIGPSLAKRIVDQFGLDTLKVLDEAPERLAGVPGLGKRRVNDIKENWALQRALSSVLVLLRTHGASHNLALRIWKHYGDRAASIVQRSPYRLALDVRGVGFKTADRLAQSIGIVSDHPERCQAGVLHVMEEISEAGHIHTPRADVVAHTAELLRVDAAHIEAAVDVLYAAGRLRVEQGSLFLEQFYSAEVETAQHILSRTGHRQATQMPAGNVERAIAAFEAHSKISLASTQRQAVELAARERIAIVTGGPGVGKTTIVRAMLRVIESQRLKVALAAPTGRAAKRLSEATGHPASTLHRLLEFDPRSGCFQRNLASPLEAHALIVDEASMIDLEMMQALLGALSPSAKLVIVGDADQLPSVGPGAVLRDLIESRVVGTVRLNEIFRQADTSGIVENAHRILAGEEPKTAAPEDPRGDFFVIKRRTPEDAAQVIRELVTERIPKRFGLDARRDIQILSPMHRGPAGTLALNEMLQSALNPDGSAIEVRGQKLRQGDKVIQTRNDYDRDVFNGDVGSVLQVDTKERKLVVRFDQGDIEYDDSNLASLNLAYALSVHKSQGSEYPAVVIPLLTTHFMMLNRSLLYTAVTRARKLCVLVADPRALSLALADTRREERRTRLAARLQGDAGAGKL